jgi:hypothetical protein
LRCAFWLKLLGQNWQTCFFTLAGFVADTLNASSTHVPGVEGGLVTMEVGERVSEAAGDDGTDECGLVALWVPGKPTVNESIFLRKLSMGVSNWTFSVSRTDSLGRIVFAGLISRAMSYGLGQSSVSGRELGLRLLGCMVNRACSSAKF